MVMFPSKHEVKMAEYYHYFCAFIDLNQYPAIEMTSCMAWNMGSKGTLASHQGGLGFKFRCLHPKRFFSRHPVSPSSQKPIFPNSNPIWNTRTSLNEWLRMLHGTHCHSLSYNRSSQATFSQIGRPVATQSSLKSIVAISPSSGKTRAMLSAVVPANVPGKQKMHLLVSWLV